MSVRFCPRCDMLLRVERKDYGLILFCPNCGFRRVVKWDDTIIVQDGVEDDFEDRIRVLGGCFATLGFDVFRRFDMNEPEFKALEVISKFEDEGALYCIGICSGINDYQLGHGGADRYWSELINVYFSYKRIGNDEDKLYRFMVSFLERPVSARSRNNKIKRLRRLFDSGFISRMLKNYDHYIDNPFSAWLELAKALNNPLKNKTVVFSMKVFDLIHFMLKGKYLDFPLDIPIPVDFHIRNVAISSGIIDENASDEEVRRAWMNILREVNKRISPKINLLRIDSVVWQVGKIMYENNFDKNRVRKKLVKLFVYEIEADEKTSLNLIDNLTLNIDRLKHKPR